MSVLSQFYLYPSIADGDERRLAGKRLAAFHRALNGELRRERIRAPFVKVGVTITPGREDVFEPRLSYETFSNAAGWD